MWGRRKQKQPQAPLVPGRDRPRRTEAARQVYSYHSSRSSTLSGENVTARATRSGDEVRQQPARSVLQQVITWGCVVVIGACAVKVLALTPHAKVVVSSNEAHVQLPTDSYAETTNALMRRSALNRNKITLDANGIAQSIASQHPELTSVVVAPPLIGNRPVVYVATARPACVLQTPSGNYTVSDAGYILARTEVNVAGAPLLKDASNRPVVPGKQYLAGSTVEFVSTVAYQLQKAGVHVESFELPVKAPYELVARLAGVSYYVRFNLVADAMQQSGGAIAMLDQLGQNPPREYVDMRVPGRAYYR